MSDPVDPACTDTYSVVTNLNIMAYKLSKCMNDPTSQDCTATYSDATNLNKLVDGMYKCMINPSQTSCTNTYSDVTTLPKVSQWVSSLSIHGSLCRFSLPSVTRQHVTPLPLTWKSLRIVWKIPTLLAHPIPTPTACLSLSRKWKAVCTTGMMQAAPGAMMGQTAFPLQFWK